MQTSAGPALFLFLVSSLLSAGAGATEPAGFAGRWEGAILFEEGRTELDMVAVFERSEEGEWTAVLDMPLVGVRDLEVQEIEVTEHRIDLTFDMEDGGGARRISARLVNEDTIEGHFGQGTQLYPLYLARRDASEEAQEVEVVELVPPGTEQLRRRFNAQRGAVRLVLLLAPS